MQFFTCGQPSPCPALPQDGAVMIMDGDGPDIVASAHLQVSGLTEKEIAAASRGRLEIGLVRVACQRGAFPVFLVKVAEMLFDAPLSIGVEAEDKRKRLTHALSHAGNLTRSATWPLTLEIAERTTHTTKSIRMFAPSPRFWKTAAVSLLDSASVTWEVQQEMLQRLSSKYPLPSQLLRRAVHVEKF